MNVMDIYFWFNVCILTFIILISLLRVVISVYKTRNKIHKKGIGETNL